MIKPTLQSVVILDACVLYPAPVRDLLLSVAHEGLFIPKWTPIIQEEWLNALLSNRPELDREQLQKTQSMMRNAFPEAEIMHQVEKKARLPLLPDLNDQHIFEAAVSSNASFIVTFNLRDFPDRLVEPLNIRAIHPDSFLCKLYKESANVMYTAFKKQLERLQHPPLSDIQLFNILTNCNLSKIVGYLSAHLS